MHFRRRPHLKGRGQKFRNKPVTIDGHRFDSRAEARRYGALFLMQQAGEIRGLTVHPRYVLQEAFSRPSGEKVSAVVYEADFAYQERRCDFKGGGCPHVTIWREVVEEVKGFETAVWKVKRKLFWKRYPELELRVIAAGK